MLLLFLMMSSCAQRKMSFNEHVISRRVSAAGSDKPDHLDDAPAEDSSSQVASHGVGDASTSKRASGWERLRSGDASAALKAAVDSRSGVENAQHAESVQVGESARPSIFQRRPSMFTASADDVSSIEVLSLTCRHAHMLCLFASHLKHFSAYTPGGAGESVFTSTIASVKQLQPDRG